MKIFNKKVLLFISPIVLCFFLFLVTLILVSQVLTSHSNQYVFDKDKEIVFMGDSHITNSIIDSLIPKAVNLSKISESYYYTFQKLKFINKKKKIKKIILGYSYHSISAYYDKFINGIFSTILPHKLFFILEFKEQLRVLKWNKKNLLLVLKKITLSAFYQYFDVYSKKIDYWFIDGYYNHFKESKVNSKSIEKRIKFQFYSDVKVINFANLNLIYLNKIIKYCRENNIELYFLTTPLHKEYINSVPKSYKRKFVEISTNEKVKIINMENLDLSDSCFTQDGDHVNEKGALITTNFFKVLSKKRYSW